MEQLEGQISIDEYLENREYEILFKGIENIFKKYGIENNNDKFSEFLKNLGKS